MVYSMQMDDSGDYIEIRLSGALMGLINRKRGLHAFSSWHYLTSVDTARADDYAAGLLQGVLAAQPKNHLKMGFVV